MLPSEREMKLATVTGVCLKNNSVIISPLLVSINALIVELSDFCDILHEKLIVNNNKIIFFLFIILMKFKFLYFFYK